MSTPDTILAEIRATRLELLRGPESLEVAELEAERLRFAAQLAFDKVLMQVEGSIPEKQAQARAGSVVEQDAAFVASAVLSRVKVKIRVLEAALVSLQSELKITAREAGL